MAIPQKYREKLRIPKNKKKDLLKELEIVYSITKASLYLNNGFLEKKYLSDFEQLKEQARLMTLYKTDADRLNPQEEKEARSYFRIDCRNMIGNCFNLSQM